MTIDEPRTDEPDIVQSLAAPVPPPAPSPERDRWRKPTAAGALGVSTAAVAINGLAGEVIPPLVVIAVLFAAGAVLVLKNDARWPRYGIAVLSVLVVVGNAPFVIADLGHPESFAGFAPILVMMLAVVVTIVGGIASARRSSLAVPPVVGAIAAVGVFALMASAALTLSLSDDEPEVGDVEIVAEDAEFSDQIVADAGTVGFLIDNNDIYRHTFLIEGTDVSQEVPGSTARRVEADLEPGTYRYYCDVPGHEDMEGTLVVG